MAASLRHRSDGEDLVENHEINVTPFIDVMLVLLIIFMVAAPLATVDINVDLPNSAAAPTPRPDKPIYVTVEEDLSVSLGEENVPHAELEAALERASGGDPDKRIFLRADKAIAYGELMKVMNLLRISGYTKIALVGLETAAPQATAPADALPR